MSDSAGSGITWGLVVFGWITTHFLSLKREQRKEVRSKLDNIKTQLSKLEIDSTIFHTGSSFSPEKARLIVLNIQRISREIEREPKIKVNTSRARFDFRKAITLKNFDKSEFSTLDQESDFFDKIATAHDNLINQLETNYIKFYRDSFF